MEEASEEEEIIFEPIDEHFSTGELEEDEDELELLEAPEELEELLLELEDEDELEDDEALEELLDAADSAFSTTTADIVA